MPGALVRALSAPLRELQATLGAGTPDVAPAVSAVRAVLADVATTTGRAWQDTRWSGEAAEAAAEFTAATVASIQALAERAARLGSATADATAAVARARERLQSIVDEFEARATELEAAIDEPGTADELLAESRRALADARTVLDQLRVELDGHRAVVAAPERAPAATAPMGALPGFGGLGAGSDPGSGSGLGSNDSGLGSTLGAASPAGLLGRSGPSTEGSSHAGEGVRTPTDPGVFGSGVDVRLPDGSTSTAPNAVAASAVRHALTQLGVPYDWGGTTPGVGLDCSGLTQWAYHEAGLDLPRLAQEQDVGAAVDQGSLRPGDLAVWDGHVAMIVGNGLMIEAGSPVKLSPIRTSNAGQGFQGFWRPTA